MNGQSGRPKNSIEAMLAAQQTPPQHFAQFFGLGIPTLRALGVNIVPCICGKCQGLGVQLEARMHFPLVGPPEIIQRGDAVKVAQAEAPKGEAPKAEETKS